ncbi:hypothetical protein V6N13_083623 [Hibiscus sabdariffa]
MASPLTDEEMVDLGRHDCVERVQWVLDTPKPPGLCQELIRTAVSCRNKLPFLNMQSGFKDGLFSMLQATFPVLSWCQNYKANQFKHDLLAGLTLASLCIPQSIGYATLAKLDPQYGLCPDYVHSLYISDTSVVPPLIYAVMGTSREIAIRPVAVVSLLLSSMVQKVEDPMANPVAYQKLVLTVTFFAGTFQAAFGLFRSGFLVDFLLHAAIVGFMAGAAIVIGLQQLKGLFGITHFTNKTDVVSVMKTL